MNINGIHRRMDINLDASVTFLLQGDRKVTVDALELEDFVGNLWDTKATLEPKKDEAGNPLLGEDGQPLTERMLDWKTIIDAVTAWVKEQTQIVLKKSEAIGLWQKAPGVWAKKKQSWLAPAPVSPDSPTSPASTDPRSWD